MRERNDSFPTNDYNSDLVADFLVNHVYSNPSSSLSLAEGIDKVISTVLISTPRQFNVVEGGQALDGDS